MQGNRSSERRRLTPRLVALLLTLAAALAVLLVGNVDVGQAQTAASLIEVEGGGSQIGFEGERALGFRTAASAGTGFDGWLVTEVELRIRPDDGTGTIRTATPPGLAICEATSSGDPHPNGTCYPLTAPATVQIPTGMTTGQEVTYTATGSGHFLATDTEYTLHFTENGSTHANGVHHLDASGNDGEAVFVAGSFGNAMRELRSDGTWGGSSTNVAWTRITGYPGAARTNAGYSGALVSNIVQTSSGTSDLAVLDVVQDFTTGENDAGYTLGEIEITLQGAGAGTPPTVTLHSGTATGPKVADFTGPSSLVTGSASNYTYVPTTTVTLSKSTIYFVVVQGGDGLWAYTTSNYEEFAAPGWIIGNVSITRPEDSTNIFATPVAGPGLLRVKGTVNQPPPGLPGLLVASRTQTGMAFVALGNQFDRAQKFTTGPNPAGYTLTQVELILISSTGGAQPTVTLRSGSATGTTVVNFPSNPTPLLPGLSLLFTFFPIGTANLSASTDYWVVVEGGPNDAQILTITDHGEDPGSATGWSIEDGSENRSASATGPFSTSTSPLWTKVSGRVNPPSPRSLVSNVGQTDAGQDAISETHDLAQSFTTGSNRAGYVLNSVDIRFVSTASGVSSAPPTVTLHTGSAAGTAVAVLSRTGAIMAKDNYEFAAASPVPLTHSTTYWVVAEGGGAGLAWVKTSSTSEDSGGAGGWMIADKGEFRTANSNGVFSQFSAGVKLSLRVNGLSNPSPATGAGRINAPNAFRVPAKLFVTFAGVVDLNGVTNIADNATYTWQRFAANGTTLEAASIGTGPTYTLTDQDAGRKLRVVVRFFDDDGYPEGPLNSAPTPEITPAATCAAPTLTGGAAQLGPARKVTVESYGMSPNLTYGFSATEPAGILDYLTFTTDASNDYEIKSIHTTGSSLKVGLNMALTANEKRTVALHVCDQAYAFKSASVWSSTYTFTSPSQDWSGHAERIVYLSQDIFAPTFVSATVNGTSLEITFNEDLGAAASLANGAFTVKKGSGGTTQTLSSTAPSISGRTVTLTLATASAVTATDTDVKVLYTKPTTGTANKLVDSFGNEATTFNADQEVTNELADSVPPELSRDRSRVLISNLAQDTDDTPGGGDLAQPFRTGANPGGYTVESIDIGTYDSPTISSLPAVTLRSGSATGTIVGTPATPGSAPIAGVLTYTFGTPVSLDASTPYWVVTGVAGTGFQWWVAAVDSTDATTASGWTLPGKGQQKSGASFVDLAGNAYLQLQINGVRVDPAVTDGAVLAADGLTLTLTYNEALKTASVPAAAAFTVKATPAGGGEAEVALASSDAVTVSGSTVVLKLAVPIAHNDGSVRVSYAKPGTGAVIEDANGNDAADFDRAVTNNSTVPRVSIEPVHADASPGIANPVFRVRRSNSGGALTVNIGINQAAAYLVSTTQTITIPAGVDSATATFRSEYQGNTSGDLTATVSGGNGYLPAVAPDNSATVRMKVPASGPTVRVSHQHLNVTVNEDGGHCGSGSGVQHRRWSGAAEDRSHCRGSHGPGNCQYQPGLQTYQHKCPLSERGTGEPSPEGRTRTPNPLP